jgi:hypothetical protein
MWDTLWLARLLRQHMIVKLADDGDWIYVIYSTEFRFAGLPLVGDEHQLRFVERRPRYYTIASLDSVTAMSYSLGVENIGGATTITLEAISIESLLKFVCRRTMHLFTILFLKQLLQHTVGAVPGISKFTLEEVGIRIIDAAELSGDKLAAAMVARLADIVKKQEETRQKKAATAADADVGDVDEDVCDGDDDGGERPQLAYNGSLVGLAPGECAFLLGDMAASHVLHEEDPIQ